MPNDQAPLLHTCCAPCSGPIIEQLLRGGFSPTIFFYNPNIFPRQEYELRKASVVAFARKLKLVCIDADYDTEKWLDRIKGYEKEQEKGQRCSICFDLRLERTARFAHDNGYTRFATTNGIARWKDLEQVDASGIRAALPYPRLSYMAINWRKKGGITRLAQIAAREGFYKQEYCGCRFSLLSRNEERKIRGLSPVEHGLSYYGS